MWQVVFNILEVNTFNSYSGIKNINTGVPQNRNLLPALYNVFIILLNKKISNILMHLLNNIPLKVKLMFFVDAFF